MVWIWDEPVYPILRDIVEELYLKYDLCFLQATSDFRSNFQGDGFSNC